MRKLFCRNRCDEITDHADITKVEVYRTVYIFNLSFHIHVFVQYHPKALTCSGWNYVFLTYMELKITWECCMSGSNNYKFGFIITDFEFILYHPRSDVRYT